MLKKSWEFAVMFRETLFLFKYSVYPKAFGKKSHLAIVLWINFSSTPYWNKATSCFVLFAMSKAHWITCWVTKFWFNGSACERTIKIRHSVSKWVAEAVREESEADTALSSGDMSSGNRTTMSVTARTIRSEQGMNASNFSSLAEIRSSWKWKRCSWNSCRPFFVCCLSALPVCTVWLLPSFSQLPPVMGVGDQPQNEVCFHHHHSSENCSRNLFSDPLDQRTRAGGEWTPLFHCCRANWCWLRKRIRRGQLRESMCVLWTF